MLNAVQARVPAQRGTGGGEDPLGTVTSEAGAPCVVRHGIADEIEGRDESGGRLRGEKADDGAIRIRLRKGESALITARGDRPDLRIRPVKPNVPATAWALPA
ncbi:hypothetical protein [Streptomyces sp. NPDC001820]|uniref:hypothetical protein n=1 Tax=Streptomyces sp. NPDC001820 TaxID=3364613 RepID=UPI0036B1059A